MLAPGGAVTWLEDVAFCSDQYPHQLPLFPRIYWRSCVSLEKKAASCLGFLGDAAEGGLTDLFSFVCLCFLLFAIRGLGRPVVLAFVRASVRASLLRRDVLCRSVKKKKRTKPCLLLSSAASLTSSVAAASLAKTQCRIHTLNERNSYIMLSF